MSVAPLGPRIGGWVRPVALPRDLRGLRGALTGMVSLPLRLYSSGLGPARVFDLRDEAERIEMYQIVLTEGTVDDLCHYIDGDELVRLWLQL